MSTDRTDSNYDSVTGPITFISVVNISFMIVMSTVLCFPTSKAGEYVNKAILMEFLLLISAITFNIIVIAAVHKGKGNMRVGIKSICESLWGNVRLYMQPYQRYYLHNEKVKVDVTCAYENTPPGISFDDKKRLNPSISDSEPLKKYFGVSKATEKENLLSVKEKYMPIRSPELFKNKIYVTRRSLINSQDSI